MPLPKSLQDHVDSALKMVQDDPQHDFNPVARWEFMRAIRALPDPKADRARCWLTILSAYHVLPLYNPARRFADIAEAMSFKYFADALDSFRYVYAHEAVALAIRVMEKKFDVDQALRIAGNMHYTVGGEKSMSLQSWFIEMAANKALGEVTSTHDFFELQWGKTPPAKITHHHWHLDAAGAASVAWSCVVDPAQVDPTDGIAAWNWWISNPHRDAAKLLEFWQWWLQTALPQAWELALDSA
jgi:hypothetical protein